MSKNKLKTVVLMVTPYFLKNHNRYGEPTDFAESIAKGFKIHTLRNNYKYWLRKIQMVQLGEAVLSIRQWKGKPYESQHHTLFELTSKDGVGIEKYKHGIMPGKATAAMLAHNDGLSLEDFDEWFKAVSVGEPMALIHFTSFRYKGQKFNEQIGNRLNSLANSNYQVI